MNCKVPNIFIFVRLRYGWNDKLFISRKEDIFFFPRVEAPEIKLDIILKKNYKNEKFNGIPFIL